ncbi:hypothetical protein J6590_019128 [Homalodisca vitripennis]|nr:hypothetical protein J6590_019128 [Homalodisca vitripennis]
MAVKYKAIRPPFGTSLIEISPIGIPTTSCSTATDNGLMWSLEETRSQNNMSYGSKGDVRIVKNIPDWNNNDLLLDTHG